MTTGLYIHIPFCRSKCGYCSFASIPWKEALAERYWRAVVREMEIAVAGQGRAPETVDTIFFGGGTPSLLPAGHIAGILDACRRLFRLDPDCEISLEANPGTLTNEKAQAYRSCGVNRISLGGQSFADEELTAIGRGHTVRQIAESMAMLRSRGPENIGLDLILGLPGQSEHSWFDSLDKTVALAPAHISIYMLELEAESPLYQSVAAGRQTLPEEDSVAGWYLQTIDFLDARDYGQYEISNFCRSGCECRHNLKYWLRQPVLGFGAAAHSFDGGSRSANVADVARYVRAVENGMSPVAWSSVVDAEAEMGEMLYLGLRLNRGLDWEEVRRACRSDRLVDCESALKEMAGIGLVEWQGNRVRLTRRGMLLSNEVFQQFVQPWADH